MISDVATIMGLKDATVWRNEKIGGHFAHLPVYAAPEAVSHRADPVYIETRQQHRHKESKPGSFYTVAAVHIELWIWHQIKWVMLLSCIFANVMPRRMEESDYFESALVQS